MCLDVAQLTREVAAERAPIVVAEFNGVQWQVHVRLLHRPVQSRAAAHFTQRHSEDVAAWEARQPEQHSALLSLLTIPHRVSKTVAF